MLVMLVELDALTSARKVAAPRGAIQQARLRHMIVFVVYMHALIDVAQQTGTGMPLLSHILQSCRQQLVHET